MWNHNNLLPGARYGTKGVTGLKTGFTNRAGFCLAVTCTRNGETLLAVMTGFKTLKERDSFAKALLNWGYRRSAALNKKN
jgi:D-alanyl-D-alanine carboxypeptidase (penicillin-binding protein 5/6)